MLSIPPQCMFPWRRSDKTSFHWSTEGVQIKCEFFVGVFLLCGLRAIVSMESTPLFTMIVLETQITWQDQFLPCILLMGGHFQVIHFAIRQFDITAVSIIFHTGRIGYTMRSGEETCLLIDITHGEIRSICPSLILGKESDIAFNACCILQFTPIDGDSLCQVDNRIRRNMIVAEVLFRITNVRVPGIFFDSQHQWSSDGSIDWFTKQCDISKHPIIHRHGRWNNIYHSSHRITAIKQWGGAFQYIDRSDVESIQL